MVICPVRGTYIYAYKFVRNQLNVNLPLKQNGYKNLIRLVQKRFKNNIYKPVRKFLYPFYFARYILTYDTMINMRHERTCGKCFGFQHGLKSFLTIFDCWHR